MQIVMESFGTSHRVDVISDVFKKFDVAAVFANFCIVHSGAGTHIDRR